MTSVQKLKTPLFLIIFLLTGAALYLLLTGRTGPAQGSRPAENIETAPDIVIDTISQTSLEKGEKQWELTAAEARFQKEKEETVFTDISLTAHAENGPVRVTGNRGIMDMTTNDMDLSGNVKMTYGNYKIFTQTLHYQANNLIIHTKDPVRINGDLLHFTGDTMKFDMTTETVILSGNIKGILSEDTVLE
ncbi:MAG: LPS export ABC transporter periplasmic protein LptC [Thermodesulfobacteriota bacterium]|nr:LPS export ABC transporter periplasmic protein LptC [Thermodesulfobacteriota bacterium]